jgi:hypothetical protein
MMSPIDVSVSARGRAPMKPIPLLVALTLGLLVGLVATRAAEGEVPTTADIAACNAEAPRAVRAGAAAPTTGDHVRADGVRGSAPTVVSPGAAGIESPDPQIHGMETEGAKNAAYQAAYRSCMRRKGF